MIAVEERWRRELAEWLAYIDRPIRLARDERGMTETIDLLKTLTDALRPSGFEDEVFRGCSTSLSRPSMTCAAIWSST
jgi:hypothetical protein